MITEVRIAPRDIVLRVADGSIGASELPANTNAGPYVERCQKVTGNKKGDAWCASWVARIGVAALGKLWPVLRTGGCLELGRWAAGRGVLRETPEPGDVFLLWYDSKGRFAHTGFVVRQNPDGSWTTYEGNTNDEGSREGYVVAEKQRRFKPTDRFVRWTELVVE